MQPSDNSAVIRLITEFDADLTTRFLVDSYTAIISGTEIPTFGVVVECAGVDGLVGMGTFRFCRVQYNGEVMPLAFLDGLKVHKDFRGQGLGYQIANWRIQKGRKLHGEGCVIATSDTVNHPPTMLRILNAVLHLLLADSVICDIAVNGLMRIKL